MDRIKLLDQINASKKAGYSDKGIVSGFQNFLNTLPPDQLSEGEKQNYLSAKTSQDLQNQLIQNTAVDVLNPINGTLASMANPMVMAQKIMQPTGVALGKAGLTASAGPIIAAGKQVITGQGIDQPVNVPGVGNINPQANTPGQNVGLAAEVASQIIPTGSSWGGHIASSALSGGLWNAGSTLQIPGASAGDVAISTATGATMGAATTGAAEFIQRWPSIKASATRFLSGIKEEDLKAVNPDQVFKNLNNDKTVLETVQKTQDALDKANAIKFKEFQDGENKLLLQSQATIDGKTPLNAFKDTLSAKGIIVDPEGKLNFDNAPAFQNDPKLQQRTQGLLDQATKQLTGNGEISQVLAYDANGYKQALGKSAFQGKTTEYKSLMKDLYTNINSSVLTAVPEMKAINNESSAWLTIKDQIGGKLDKMSSGEAALTGLFGKNKVALRSAMEEVQKISGVDFIDEIRATNIANAIRVGKTGPFGAIIGALGGVAAGGLIHSTGVTGPAIGMLFGSRMGRRLGPAINTQLGKAAISSLATSPIGQAVQTSGLPASVVASINNTFHSLTPSPLSPGQKEYVSFAEGYRKEFPSASDVQVEQAFMSFKSAHQAAPEMPTPELTNLKSIPDQYKTNLTTL